MYGLGVPEVIALVLVGFVLFAMAAGIVAVIVVVTRRQPGRAPDDTATLLEENQRLRDEIARLKRGQS